MQLTSVKQLIKNLKIKGSPTLQTHTNQMIKSDRKKDLDLGSVVKLNMLKYFVKERTFNVKIKQALTLDDLFYNLFQVDPNRISQRFQ